MRKHVLRLFPHHKKHIFVWTLLDIGIIFGAYFIAFSARAVTATLGSIWHSADFIAFAVIINLMSLYLFGAYHRIWSRTSGHDVIILVGAFLVATAIISVVNISIAEVRPLPMSVVLLGNMLSLVGFVAFRYRSRLVSGLSWRWRAVWYEDFPERPPRIRVLMIGAGESGRLTVMHLRNRISPTKEIKHHIVGFVDDDPSMHGMFVEGRPVLGSRADIPRLVIEHDVGLIIIAVHNISGADFREILSLCESTRALIKLVPDMLGVVESRKSVPLLRDVRAEDFLGRKPIGRHEAIDFSPITGKTILVTGAAGSIGSELCRQLLDFNPLRVIAFDSNESSLHDLVVDLRVLLENNYPQVELIPFLGDITQRNALVDIFEQYRPQVVFHAAAYKHVTMLELYPGEALRVNVGGTLQVAELARDYKAERFVLISTDKAVNPSGVMGASKRICEMVINALAQQNSHQTLFTSVRFGNVLGSRGSVVPTFNRQIDSGGPVTVTNTDMKRYFMSIPEAVNLVLHAACLTQGNDVFILKMGELMRIVELAERMIRMRGLRPHEDISIHFTGVRPGEKLYEELQEQWESSLATLHPNIMLLIKHTNGFRPPDFLQEVRQLVNTGLNTEMNALDQLNALMEKHLHTQVGG